MNRERLMKLADHLDTVPEAQFDMTNWKSTCGTAACAAGHAAMMPEFNEEGFVLRSESSIFGTYYYYYPAYQGYKAFEACENFFNLHWKAADYIFSQLKYGYDVTPKEVAQRIREFVAKQEEQP